MGKKTTDDAKQERPAIERRLERFLDAGEPEDDEPLPVTVRIELLKAELERWKNTLKHMRDMYALAQSVKDEERKRQLWDEALRCMKWKEELERKIAILQR